MSLFQLLEIVVVMIDWFFSNKNANDSCYGLWIQKWIGHRVCMVGSLQSFVRWRFFGYLKLWRKVWQWWGLLQTHCSNEKIVRMGMVDLQLDQKLVEHSILRCQSVRGSRFLLLRFLEKLAQTKSWPWTTSTSSQQPQFTFFLAKRSRFQPALGDWVEQWTH